MVSNSAVMIYDLFNGDIEGFARGGTDRHKMIVDGNEIMPATMAFTTRSVEASCRCASA